MGKKKYKKEKHWVEEEEQNPISDEEWAKIQLAIKTEIEYNDVIWEGIKEYIRLDDEFTWDPWFRPTVYEFAESYYERYLKFKKEEKEDNEGWNVSF